MKLSTSGGGGDSGGSGSNFCVSSPLRLLYTINLLNDYEAEFREFLPAVAAAAVAEAAHIAASAAASAQAAAVAEAAHAAAAVNSAAGGCGMGSAAGSSSVGGGHKQEEEGATGSCEGKESDGDASLMQVQLWLKELGVDESVRDMFLEEEIDVLGVQMVRYFICVT